MRVVLFKEKLNFAEDGRSSTLGIRQRHINQEANNQKNV